MTLIYAYKDRGITRDIQITDADGNTITPGENDVIRAIIAREGQTAKLTVASNAPTVNGSTFTKGAQNRLRLDASDLNFSLGVYTLTIDYTDNADGSELKMIDEQVFHLEDAP